MDSDIVVDSKGRILIPKEIRKKLNIKSGSKLILKIEDERLVLLRATPLKDFQSELESFQEKLKKLTTEPISTDKLF
ncbi:MAG: AbrB/MazE/SpoVT family DNA-binding domain-containing protein [Promethearchaeota archaeon]|jgi:AbrB family looped-hinge helix DNA binding protein|nr:MAG: AbrB/MazE/SpoVT family DNA-binding domain-containing protein [Candidatus Lokiarchaeota archaeon]